MNKRVVDEWLLTAYKVLADVKIFNEKKEKNPDEKDKYDRIVIDNTIDKSWRGQIASFGAAIAMGSLTSAVAFFCTQGGAKLNRSLLLKAIWMLLTKKGDDFANWPLNENGKEKAVGEVMYSFVDARVKADPEKAKEDFINAAIALKLAMNLYALKEG